MYLLGAYLPDNKLVRVGLTSFYGISHQTAFRLCARLQLHERCTVGELSEAQVTALSAYLSSPSTVPARKPENTSPFPSILQDAHKSATSQSKDSTIVPPSQREGPDQDPLRSIVLEADLRREMRANIAHHRIIGSYKGKRHMAGLPVRGQNTRNNALTARRLNKLERKNMSTWARPPVERSSILEMVAKARSHSGV